MLLISEPEFLQSADVLQSVEEVVQSAEEVIQSVDEFLQSAEVLETGEIVSAQLISEHVTVLFAEIERASLQQDAPAQLINEPEALASGEREGVSSPYEAPE